VTLSATKPVNIAVVRKSQAGFGNTIRKPRIKDGLEVEADDEV